MERNLVLSDFNNIPGSLVNGSWIFPQVETNSNATDKKRVWEIIVSGSINNALIDINIEWINGKTQPPETLEVFYFTVSGQVGGKMTRSTNKTITAGKVKRNIIQQAISEANNLWRKQVSKSSGELIKPQLLTDLDIDSLTSVYKKFKKPTWYVSYKYDGVRCMATYKDDKVFIYSRTCKEYELPHIADALKSLLEKNPGIILDGEMYLHGMSQSTISGFVRSNEETKLTPNEKILRGRLIYHIFDIVDPTNLTITFADRYNKLIELIQPSQFYIPVECIKISDQPNMIAKADFMMKTANSMNLEGIVLRIGEAGYDESINGYHSINVLKKKPVLNYEFRIIGFNDGKGKNEGVVQWICDVPENLREKGGSPGKQFNVVPKGDLEIKKELFERLSNEPGFFEKEYLGMLISIEFMCWSDHGIPTQVRAISIRSIYDL
jgi:ATP-dependent DNA ligase